ncbi:CHASE3 domain-containing protein [Sphingobium algorifonticola]|nr:CHASE3 domain-containing protein [Sphingobium algorifonticola]
MPTPRAAPKLWRSLMVASLVPLLLAGLTLWFASEYRRAAQTNDAVDQSFRRQLAIESVFSAVQDAETGQRGYVITGDPDFLEPYRNAGLALPKDIAALEKLLSGDPVGSAQLPKLRRLIDLKFAELERVLAARDAFGRDAAASIIVQGRGKQIMDDFRAHVATMVRDQNAMLARNLAFEDRRNAIIRAAAWVVVILSTILAMLGAVIVHTARAARYRAQQQVAEATARQTAIFRHSLDAIILVNPSGSMEMLNSAAERMFGYPSQELLRRDLSLVIDIAPGTGPFLDRLGVKGDTIEVPLRTPLEARTADGVVVPVEVALGTMPLEDGIHIVAAFRDISGRARVEKMKDQFLSTISHELRTPLTSIVGSLGLLRGGATQELPSDAQRLVVIAENNANRLIRLVNDLLDVEKMQTGLMTFDFEQADMRDIARRSLDSIRGMATTRAICLGLTGDDRPLAIHGDTDRLMQVIVNLLSNAISYSPEGGAVTLSLAMQFGYVHVAVTDQGPGIDPDLRARLFTRFAQSAHRTGPTPGTGLGLAISREIVHNHGGRIWWEPALDTSADTGSTFTFTVPLWNGLSGQIDDLGARRLLLFCDAHEAATIGAAFSRREIEADVVADHEAALTALANRHYVALVMDFQFAGEDALTTLQQIRADPLHRSLPVIAIAGETPPLPPEKTAALDIIDWIFKPVSPFRLNHAVGAAVERAAVAMPLVLHIDDDIDTLEITERALVGLARIAKASDLSSARSFLAMHDVDLLIVDIALPDGSGLDILADLNRTGSERIIPVIVYSAQDVGSARVAPNVEAVLLKSKRSLPTLVETVMNITQRSSAEKL